MLFNELSELIDKKVDEQKTIAKKAEDVLKKSNVHFDVCFFNRRPLTLKKL